MTRNELVYGVTECSGRGSPDGSLVVLPRDLLRELADQRRAAQCETWGQLRRTCSPCLYREIVGLAGYGSFEEMSRYLEVGRPIPGVQTVALKRYHEAGFDPPSDETPFDAYESIPAFADGDWPPSVFLLMKELLPFEVIQTYGEVYTTVFNGDFVEFDPADKGAILEQLECLGLLCTEDQGLIDATQPSIVGPHSDR